MWFAFSVNIRNLDVSVLMNSADVFKALFVRSLVCVTYLPSFLKTNYCFSLHSQKYYKNFKSPKYLKYWPDNGFTIYICRPNFALKPLKTELLTRQDYEISYSSTTKIKFGPTFNQLWQTNPSVLQWFELQPALNRQRNDLKKVFKKFVKSKFISFACVAQRFSFFQKKKITQVLSHIPTILNLFKLKFKCEYRYNLIRTLLYSFNIFDFN